MNKRSFASVAATFILCFVFWLLLTMSLEPAELLGGVVVCGITAWFSAGFFIQSDKGILNRLNVFRWLRFVGYLFFCLLPEIIKANINMAKIVLKNIPLKQCIIKVPVHGITDFYGLALLADSITLTPGTITTDVSWEDGQYYMYVQWLIMESEDPEEAGEIIKGRMERWIGGIYK